MTREVSPAKVDREDLRGMIQAKYTDVAQDPEMGFHFHTGAPLARMLGYSDADLDSLPEATVASFAGTGNPFAMGKLQPGETVLDVGSGAGFDTLLAAQQVGPRGRVHAVDMTDAMLAKTAAGARELGLENITTHLAYAESLPLEDGAVDVVISNGVINLTPDKESAMREIWRVLKPGGRVQLADIIVHKEVDQASKDDIELWSG